VTDEAPSNLRLLPVAEPEDDPLLTKKEPAEAHCRHQHGAIDEAAHRLCRDCGDEIDPLDFLLGLVGKWDWVRRERAAAGAKARLAANELADVERRLKNAKARLRKEGVLLSTADARRARDQLRALARTLPNLLRDVLGEDFSEARRKAEQTAKLCGYRQEDARKAVSALEAALGDVGVRRH
jgi:hypothetical protein